MLTFVLMLRRWKRIGLAAAMAAGASSVWPQDRNPYVLQVDRQPYVLGIPRGAENASAASGGSLPPPAERALPARIDETTLVRERDYERRIAQLMHERDAWKRRAESLEADLRVLRADRIERR